MTIKKSRLRKAQDKIPDAKRFQLRGILVRYITRRTHDDLDERTIYNFEVSSVTPLEEEEDTFSKYSTGDEEKAKSKEKHSEKSVSTSQAESKHEEKPAPKEKPLPAPKPEPPQDLTLGNKYFLKSKRVLGEIISRYNDRRVEINFVYRGATLAPEEITNVMEGKEGRDYLLLNGQDNDLDGVSGNKVYLILPDQIQYAKEKVKPLEIGDTITLKCLVQRVRELGRKVYFLQVEGLERAPLQESE